MKLIHHTLFICLFLFPLAGLFAQTDSVTISGRIDHLTPRLYRQSPTVLITSTNILQAGQELAHPAQLQVDGSFQITVPLIYPQEEMYFNFANISTAFLAAPGALRISIDADSLFIAEVPFRFGGVNAQVNQQYAAYKAFEAKSKNKADNRKISQAIANLGDVAAFRRARLSLTEAFQEFSARTPPFPLLNRWVNASASYQAAIFLYEKATYLSQTLDATLAPQLRPAGDELLTTGRASAMDRFGSYALDIFNRNSQAGRSGGLPVKTLASLIDRNSRGLSLTDRQRLLAFEERNAARPQDLRYLNQLMLRNPDTLQRLIKYETTIRQAQALFDSAAVDYLKAYVLANDLPTLPLDLSGVLWNHVRPQISDQRLVRSLDEAYGREVKDSTAIRAARSQFGARDSSRTSTELATELFATRNKAIDGSQLLSRILTANRGRVVYFLTWTPNDEQGQRAAFEAQRLRDQFSNRDLTLLYVCGPNTDPTLWLEYIVKHQLRGEHLYLTDDQWMRGLNQLPAANYAPAYLFNRESKIQRKGAPLPDESSKLLEQIQKLL